MGNDFSSGVITTLVTTAQKEKGPTNKNHLTIQDGVIEGWGLRWAENWGVPKKCVFLKDTDVLNLKHLQCFKEI